jgi:two-component sensor histidine kinase
VIDLLVVTFFPKENNLKLTREIESIYLDYDVAMRLAIVLNELICNSIEHALTQSETPQLFVSVRQHENELELIVRDNGPGITEELMESESIKGQGLIQKLLQKMNGKVRYSNDQGCTVTIKVSL